MSDAPPAAAPRRPRKKRRRAEHEAEGGRAEPELRPRSPELGALEAAFDRGDYATVRRDAPKLARSTDDDAVRARARELARRIEPDPIAKWMMAGAGLLLAMLAGWYWMHPHGAP
ncbi:MAG TPA: hypothetical protein VHB21_22985 [Minicystis sp.]|nr:hypothetical protein [Minicystis sp.]